jgi:SAM-dependent methyltransferase
VISAPRDYEQARPVLADAGSRATKAAKALAALRACDGRATATLTCLDLGAGSGIIGAEMAGHFGRVVACDLDPDGLAYGRARFARPNLEHVVADATRLPLAARCCDVVLCMHVYEHVASAEALVAEIRRVLKPNGVCLLSGPNRLRPYEPHLKLWLVHWLPRRLTDRLLGWLGREPYQERLRTRWGLMRLLHDFEVVDLNPRLVAEPERFHTAGEPGMRLARALPGRLRAPLLALFAPSFNLLLRVRRA